MRKISLAIPILLLPVLLWSVPDVMHVAIIVNKGNSTDDVSFKDLMQILRQERQFWEGGKKIYLVMQETNSREKKIILREIFQMNDKELKKLWLTKMYRGKIASFPKTLSSNEAVKRFVSQVPNSIGYIDASLVDESIKVLRIDGLLPKDEKYKLNEGLRYAD